jgi:ketosteroid isomerase-like protein
MGADKTLEPAASGFAYAAFKSAFETQNIETWLSFFDEDAEWIEYRHNAPPASPNRMRGKTEICAFLARVKSSDVRLELSDEVLGTTRAAFCVTCTLPDGRRIIENVIVHLKEGKIIRQVDVEAWD